jgi:hypothetical protein
MVATRTSLFNSAHERITWHVLHEIRRGCVTGKLLHLYDVLVDPDNSS